MVKYPGIEFEFEIGKNYIIPPMSLRDLKTGKLETLIKWGDNPDLTDTKTLEFIVDAILCSLNRNYPELTKSELEDMLDLGNLFEVFKCVMDVNGFIRKNKELEGEHQTGEVIARE